MEIASRTIFISPVPDISRYAVRLRTTRSMSSESQRPRSPMFTFPRSTRLAQMDKRRMHPTSVLIVKLSSVSTAVTVLTRISS